MNTFIFSFFPPSEIQNNVEYKYQIQSVSGKYKSHLSPSLIFNSKYGFCGDGVIDEEIGEECDDGNLRNNDGCNTQCKIETTFNCKLQPSLCYVYESDGNDLIFFNKKFLITVGCLYVIFFNTFLRFVVFRKKQYIGCSNFFYGKTALKVIFNNFIK